MKNYRNNNMRGKTSITVKMWKILSVLLAIGTVWVESSHIRINDDGGYENIVVSIGKEVPPMACPQLIQNIQVCPHCLIRVLINPSCLLLFLLGLNHMSTGKCSTYLLLTHK